MRPPSVDAAYVDRLTAFVAATGEPASRAVAPFDGEPLPAIPQSTVSDVAQAAIRARAAQEHWAATPLSERIAIVLRFAQAVLADRDRLLDVVQWETGKSRVHGHLELLGLPGVAVHYATQAPKYLATTKATSSAPGLIKTQVAHQPKGLIGVIAPWNYPLFLAIGDVLPALIAGNAVLSKADSQAPLSLLAARALADDAGIPADLWQVVAGPGSTLGEALLDQVDYIAFTGSTETGRHLAAEAGRRLISSSMELGGKNPMIVRADADLAAAALGATQGAYSNAGQICIGIERIYVHESRFDEFVKRFAEATKAIRLGATYDYSVEMGSLTSAAQLAVTEGHIADALDHGAELVAGGKARPDLGPFFHEPTILTGVTPQMKVYAEETFGPVVSVYPVVDDDDAVVRANDTDYGLSASIWSADIDAARELAGRIRAGGVCINDGYLSAIGSIAAPMGGMKSSGVGRRHAAEGILRYTEAQTVASQTRPLPYPRKPAAFLAAARGVVKAQIIAASLRNRRSN